MLFAIGICEQNDCCTPLSIAHSNFILDLLRKTIRLIDSPRQERLKVCIYGARAATCNKEIFRFRKFDFFASNIREVKSPHVSIFTYFLNFF